MRLSIEILYFFVVLSIFAVSSKSSGKQISGTNAPNFIQLVIMRFIYGIATTIGVEDRLEDTLNGAFIPPNVADSFGVLENGEGFFEDILGDNDFF